MKGIILSSVLGAALSGGYFVKNPVEIRVPITPARKDLGVVLAEVASREKIPSVLLRAIAQVESGLDETNSASKFEPHIAAKQGRENGTSYGVMQVMGYHAKKTCGLKSWAELAGEKNLENNINCGVKVLKDCVSWVKARKKPRNRVELLRHSLACYNGDASGKYSDKVMIALGEEVFKAG